MVADLAKLDKPPGIVPELQEVLSWFSDFGAFTKEFPTNGAGQAAQESQEGAQVEDGDDEVVVEDDVGDPEMEDPLEKKKKGLSKHAAMLLELCYCSFCGLADGDVATLINDGSLASLSKMREDGGGPTGEHLRELCTALEAHRRVIAVDSGATAPPPSSRTLARYNSEASDGDIDSIERKEQLAQERQEAWTKAQTLRKKVAQSAFWQPGTGITGLEKCTRSVPWSRRSRGSRRRPTVLSCSALICWLRPQESPGLS